MFLKLEIIKKAVGLVLIIVTMNYGVMAMAYSLLVSSFISQIVNTWPNRKLLHYGYLEQLKDILPGILLAVFMGVAVSFLKYLPIHNILILLLQVIAAAVIYIGGSALLKIESFHYILAMIKPLLSKFTHK